MRVCCGSRWGRCMLFINIWDSLTSHCLVYNTAMYTVYGQCGHCGRCSSSTGRCVVYTNPQPVPTYVIQNYTDDGFGEFFCLLCSISAWGSKTFKWFFAEFAQLRPNLLNGAQVKPILLGLLPRPATEMLRRNGPVIKPWSQSSGQEGSLRWEKLAKEVGGAR